MAMYEVGVRRTLSISSTIMVEAETEEGARALALLQAEEETEMHWKASGSNEWFHDSDESSVEYVETASPTK